MPDPAPPRWRKARFGGALELFAGKRWIGHIEPQTHGVFRYRGWHCAGEALTLNEAKAAVEASIPSGNGACRTGY